MKTRRDDTKARRGATWVICSLAALALALGGALHDAHAGNPAGSGKKSRPKMGGAGRNAPPTGKPDNGNKNATQTTAETVQGAAQASAQHVLEQAAAEAMKDVAGSILDQALCAVGSPAGK